MTARDTHNASVAAAETAKIASLVANEAAKQETVNVSGHNIGYNLQTGNYANFAAAVKNANNAKIAADFAAEQAKQNSIMVARDTLRGTGDRAPV